MSKKFVMASVALATMMAGAAQAAPTEITMWHAMSNTLGEWVADLTKQFNEENPDCHLNSIYKGDYTTTMNAGINSYGKSKDSPNILQVFEVGTANMIYSKGAIKPVAEIMAEGGYEFHPEDFIPAIYGYYSTKDGRMLSFPFNSSTTVMYINTDKFKHAGLPTDPEHLPKTWEQLEEAARKLKAAGETCPVTVSWMGWTQMESFSTWHNTPYATNHNGFDGVDNKLLVTGDLFKKHFKQLSDMNKEGLFVYKGRGNSADSAFYSGECAVTMGSSGALANIRRNAEGKFHFQTVALPYMEGTPGAPQNTAIGGASLWAMNGKSKAENVCVAKFFHFLSNPEVQASNHQRTGYLPITLKAYELTKASGYYDKNPGADVPVKQMLKPTTKQSRGLRLGNMPAIRIVADEELEKVWTKQQSSDKALEQIERRGNALLHRFAIVNKAQ